MQLLMDFAEQFSSSVQQWFEVFRQQDIMVDPVLLLLLAGVITLWLGCACWSSSIAEARGYGAKLHFFIGLLLPIIYPPITLIGLNVKNSGKSTKKTKKKETSKAKQKPQDQSAEQGQEKPAEHEPTPTVTHKQTEKSQPEENQNTSEDIIPDAPDLIVPEDEPSKPPPAQNKPELRLLRKTPASPNEPVAGDDAGNQPREFNKSLFREMAEQSESSGVRFRIRYAGGREVTAVEIVEATAQYAVVSVETDEGSSQRVRIPYARVEAVEPVE